MSLVEFKLYFIDLLFGVQLCEKKKREKRICVLVSRIIIRMRIVTICKLWSTGVHYSAMMNENGIILCFSKIVLCSATSRKVLRSARGPLYACVLVYVLCCTTCVVDNVARCENGNVKNRLFHD